MINLNSKIFELEELTGIKTFFNVVDEEEDLDKWIVFNYVEQVPIKWEDDAIQFDKINFIVHLYCPQTYNFFNTENLIQTFLETFCDSVECFFSLETDTKINHIVFDCEYAKER